MEQKKYQLIITLVGGNSILIENDKDSSEVDKVYSICLGAISGNRKYILINYEKEDTIINPAHIICVKRIKS